MEYKQNYQLDITNEPELREIENTVSLSMLTEPKKMVSVAVEFKELLMRYTCAMKEIRTKIEVLNTEYNVHHSRNPINSVVTRLKQTASIFEKLQRYGIAISVENVEKHLNDVAGVRVVCSYLDDVYAVADALIKQDDVTLIAKKDYIKAPKPNGYRSLHLIISVPVFFSDVKRDMKVEVQLRTVAMEYWSSLEHQLKYKQKLQMEQEITLELKTCAEELFEIEKKMLGLRTKIDSLKEKQDEDELLLERLRKFDFPM